MSGCLALDDALPALTSRLLLLLEDEKEMVLIEPQPQRSSPTIPPRILEETKEPDEAFLRISPNRRASFMQRPRFDSVPELALPNLMMANPKTPLSTTKGLFVSFPSSPMPQDLWQYGQQQTSFFLSPRTTDAVLLDNKPAANGCANANAVWSPTQRNKNSSPVTTTKIHNHNAILPMAPTLFPNDDCTSPNYNPSNSPPSIIRCRARSGSHSNVSGFDDDEVSLLADDPDEDDAGVLPPSTYNVVVNILDQIDRDD